MCVAFLTCIPTLLLTVNPNKKTWTIWNQKNKKIPYSGLNPSTVREVGWAGEQCVTFKRQLRMSILSSKNKIKKKKQARKRWYRSKEAWCVLAFLHPQIMKCCLWLMTTFPASAHSNCHHRQGGGDRQINLPLQGQIIDVVFGKLCFQEMLSLSSVKVC